VGNGLKKFNEVPNLVTRQYISTVDVKKYLLSKSFLTILTSSTYDRKAPTIIKENLPMLQ